MEHIPFAKHIINVFLLKIGRFAKDGNYILYILVTRRFRLNKSWYNITYFSFCGWLPDWFYSWWKDHRCTKSHHLFDEVLSISEHCIFCDACGLTVELGKEYMDEVIY